MDFHCGNLSTDKGECCCLCAINIRNKKKVKLNRKGVPGVEARLIFTTILDEVYDTSFDSTMLKGDGVCVCPGCMTELECLIDGIEARRAKLLSQLEKYVAVTPPPQEYCTEAAVSSQMLPMPETPTDPHVAGLARISFL